MGCGGVRIRVYVRPGLRGYVMTCSQKGFQPCGNASADLDEVEWAAGDRVGSASQQSGVVWQCQKFGCVMRGSEQQVRWGRVVGG